MLVPFCLTRDPRPVFLCHGNYPRTVATFIDTSNPRLSFVSRPCLYFICLLSLTTFAFFDNPCVDCPALYNIFDTSALAST